MNKLEANEMYQIIGGATITSQIINAISKAITTIYGLGQSVGSALRRIMEGQNCPAA